MRRRSRMATRCTCDGWNEPRGSCEYCCGQMEAYEAYGEYVSKYESLQEKLEAVISSADKLDDLDECVKALNDALNALNKKIHDLNNPEPDFNDSEPDEPDYY